MSDYDPLTGKHVGSLPLNQASLWNTQPFAVHNYYPPLGLRGSPDRSGPKYPAIIPYGASNIDLEGISQPSYPPVDVATSPVPAYGSPKADASEPADVTATVAEEMETEDAGNAIADIVSPSSFLTLLSSDETELVKPLKTDDMATLASMPLVDPQMEACPDLHATSLEWNTTEHGQQAQHSLLPALVPGLTAQQQYAGQTVLVDAVSGEAPAGTQLVPSAVMTAPRAYQAVPSLGQQGMLFAEGGYLPTAPYGPNHGFANAFGGPMTSEDIKIDNSRSAKKKKDPSFDPVRVYPTPIYPLPAFGPQTADGRPLFTYTRQCQLAQGRAYTAEELRMYVDSGRCVIWLQQAPSQCADRTDDDDKKCRWSSCPISARSISSGWLRVALDEFPQLTSDGTKDPFKMAGLLHLWCFEQIFDVMEFHRSGRLLPDERHLPKESNNAMAVNRDTDREIVGDAYDKWIREHSPGYDASGPIKKPREHRDSLSFALIKYHLDNQTTARQRARTSRNQDKGTELQKTIDVHVGDLSMFARVSRNCRSTARNAAKAQSQKELGREDDEDSVMTEDLLTDAWSVRTEGSPSTESDSSPPSGQRVKPAKGKQLKATRASKTPDSPKHAKTAKNVRGSKKSTPPMAGAKTGRVARASVAGKGGSAAATEPIDVEPEGGEASSYDLLSPSTWKGKAAVAASPIQEYFDPLASPFKGIVEPAVMKTPLNGHIPLVRGSIVARCLNAQKAAEARAREERERRAGPGGEGNVEMTGAGSKRKRGGVGDEDDGRPVCVDDGRGETQEMGSPAAKRRRDGEGENMAAAAPLKSKQPCVDQAASARAQRHLDVSRLAGTAETASVAEAMTEGGDLLGCSVSSLDSLFGDATTSPEESSIDCLFDDAATVLEESSMDSFFGDAATPFEQSCLDGVGSLESLDSLFEEARQWTLSSFDHGEAATALPTTAPAPRDGLDGGGMI